jgi:hypothetical protein
LALQSNEFPPIRASPESEYLFRCLGWARLNRRIGPDQGSSANLVQSGIKHVISRMF